MYWIYAACMLVLLGILVYLLLIKTRHRCGYSPKVETYHEYLASVQESKSNEEQIEAKLVDVPEYVATGAYNKIYCVDPSKKNGFFVISKSNTGAFQKLSLSNAVVGYASNGSLILFQLLCRCYGIETDRFVYVLITQEEFVTHPFGNGTIDVYAFVDDTSGSVFFNKLQDMSLYIIDYRDVDMDKVKVLMPYAFRKSVDMRMLMPRKMRMTSIYSLLVFDTLHTVDGAFSARAFQDCMAKDNDSRTLTELYARHQGSTFNIVGGIEHFANPKNVVLEADKGMPGRILINYLDAYKVFKMHGTNLNGITLQMGDRVVLTKQLYKTENGTYYVLDVSGDTMLHTMIPIESSQIQNTQTTNIRSIDRGSLPSFVKLYDAMFIVDIGVGATVVDDTDKSVMLIELHPRQKQDLGSCITNETIKNREACESKFDPLGAPKENQDVWDSRCINDTDCPFFKNVGRGGCMNGFCEMPVGVRKVGYTKYVGSPWCHGCTLRDIDTCCEKQDDPDYAFPDDDKSKFVRS